MKKQNQTYTPEFRAEAVKMVLEQGHAQGEAARRLGIPKGTLAGWMAATRSLEVSAAPGACSVAERQAENAWLRKELAEARLERDLLKNSRRGVPLPRGVETQVPCYTANETEESGRQLFGG